MECKTETVTMRVLTASPGKVLYRKTEPLDTAVFSARVYLGAGDSAENYAEISESEAKKVMEERDKKVRSGASDGNHE